MASARKDGFGRSRRALRLADPHRSTPAGQPVRDRNFRELCARLDDELLRRVVEVNRLTPTIIEVVVQAPCRGAEVQAGPVLPAPELRVVRAASSTASRLAMEGLALTGAWIDQEKGLLVADRARDGRLVAPLRAPQARASQSSCMGPTGTPTEIPHGEDVLLAGGGLGNAVLFSIAQALRDAGSRVLYFAGYKDGRRPLQAGRHRGRHRPGHLVHRHGRRDRAAPAAGPPLPRQHRPGDGRLRAGRARRAAESRSRRSGASSRSAPTA